MAILSRFQEFFYRLNARISRECNESAGLPGSVQYLFAVSCPFGVLILGALSCDDSPLFNKTKLLSPFSDEAPKALCRDLFRFGV